MSTTEIDHTKSRSMAALCRRREQLQTEGVRPDTLSWAVAEASESALAMLEMPGPEMVRKCLADARSGRCGGTEAEALLVFSAAGVGRLRAEARALGIPVPLNRHEAFREMRRTPKPEPAAAYVAIRSLGAMSVMEMMCDRGIPFHRALAERISEASRASDTARVSSLCQVAAFGVWELRRGIRVDVTEEVADCDLEELSVVLADDRPRVLLRERARAAAAEEAQLLALLSFVQTGWLGRSVRAVKSARRSRASGTPRGGRELAVARAGSEHDGSPDRQASTSGH
jgi:hypothetical protein